MNTPKLPITRRLTQAHNLSLTVALLMAVASLAGIFFQSSIYPSEELRQSFVSNDVVNLFIGLPVLLGSLWLAKRGRLIGLLFWPGALFYVTYNSLAYAVAMPFTLPFVLHVALVILSVYLVYRLLSSMDSSAIQQRLRCAVPERFAGGVLAGFGILFFLWRFALLVQSFTDQAALTGPERATAVADELLAPAWIIGGILLWRRRAFGYVVGAGLLFQLSMLFVGLLVFFILQPFLTSAPFPVEDFVVIFVMGSVCFIPFGLFVHGVLATEP